VHLFGFIMRNFVAMHGHVKVKYVARNGFSYEEVECFNVDVQILH